MLAILPGFVLGIAPPAFAQQEPIEVAPRVVINVTGSNIPRTDIETALPVQRITRDDIDRSGATTAAELLNTISANLRGQNDALSTGGFFAVPGLASANLRGLGSGSTLVLINGRRAANYAFDGGTVDLNSIPLAAVDRIEVLKDGASAIYGADAMAGVINFILRKDFIGVSVTGYTGDTQDGGGNHQQATVTAGYGDLATDHFNAFVTIDWQKDQGLAASARPYSQTAFLPDAGINKLSNFTFPANIRSDGAFYNPSRAAGCAPPASLPIGPTDPRCGFDYVRFIHLLPPVERTSVVAGATWQVNTDNQLFAQYVYAHSDLSLTAAPTVAATFNGDPVLYPADGPFYPTEFAAANGITGPLQLRYRTVSLGPRVDRVVTDAQLLTVGAEGLAASWNYNIAFIYSKNREQDSLQSGWVSEPGFLAAMATGLVNPFGASGAQGDALLASTQIFGESRSASGTTRSVEAKISKEICALPAGPLAIALGVELRRESFEDKASSEGAAGEILSGSQLGSKSASRTVDALFAELNVPIIKDVEAQLAARYDHYSDFGNTVNPKIAVRWQPVKSILLRSSWGTGFRAPTLYDLYTPLTQGFTMGRFDDPLRCPTTGLPEDCGNNFRLLTGGNPNLEPEKTWQFNAGGAWIPFDGLSLGADYWKISKTSTIGPLASDDVFNHFDKFGAANIVRGPVDPAFPNLPGPIVYVLAPTSNLGNLQTSGIDFDVSYRSPNTPIGSFTFNLNGTYILDFQQQLPGGDETRSAAGAIVDLLVPGALPRWKHYASLTWSYGSWGATIAQNFTQGYTEPPPPPPFDGLGPRRVGSYDMWDVQGTCDCFKNTSIALGIKNVFDRAPPFSNQTAYAQVGYNPQYSDPLGRVFYARVTIAFK